MGYYIARMLDDIMVRKYIDSSNYIDIAPQDFEAFKSQAEAVAQMLHEQEAKYEALKREHFRENLYSWVAGMITMLIMLAPIIYLLTINH